MYAWPGCELLSALCIICGSTHQKTLLFLEQPQKSLGFHAPWQFLVAASDPLLMPNLPEETRAAAPPGHCEGRQRLEARLARIGLRAKVVEVQEQARRLATPAQHDGDVH